MKSVSLALPLGNMHHNKPSDFESLGLLWVSTDFHAYEPIKGLTISSIFSIETGLGGKGGSSNSEL